LVSLGGLRPQDLVRLNDGRWGAASRINGLQFPRDVGALDRSNFWFVRSGNRVLGPLSSQQLVQWAQAGKVVASDEVRRCDRARWVKAERIGGLDAGHVTGARSTDGPSDVTKASGSDTVQAHQGPASGPNVGRSRTDWISTSDIFLIALLTGPFLLPPFGFTLELTGVAIVAILALAAGVVLFCSRWEPNEEERRRAWTSMLFVGIFGSTTLLQFTELAIATSEQAVGWQGGPLWLVKGVGSAYRKATGEGQEDNDGSKFAAVLVAMIFSVGICEEVLKLIPVTVAMLSPQKLKPASIIFLGASSGLAFGLAEGIWVSWQVESPEGAPFSTFLMRLVGCPLCHAVMTGLASLALATFNRLLPTPWITVRLLACTTVASLLMAVPHGLYDTLLAYGHALAAGWVMIALTIVFIWLDRKWLTWMDQRSA
jgi:RsiW-degrading membrane proteinase PrsW (M82 family)